LHHPVDDTEQIDNTLFAPVALVEQFGQPPFCRKSLPVVAFGLSGKQVSRCDQGEGVGDGEQGFDLGLVVEQIDDGEAYADFTVEEFITVGLGLPVFSVISQYREAGDGAAIFVIESVVVGEQAFGEVAVVSALGFDMDIDPVFAAVVGGHLDEFVDEPFAEFCIFDDLFKFLVKEGVTPFPIDLTICIVEVKRNENTKESRDGVFPRRVVVVISERGVHIWHLLNIR
jgi:hypothetical protein